MYLLYILYTHSIKMDPTFSFANKGHLQYIYITNMMLSSEIWDIFPEFRNKESLSSTIDYSILFSVVME